MCTQEIRLFKHIIEHSLVMGGVSHEVFLFHVFRGNSSFLMFYTATGILPHVLFNVY